MIGFNLNITRVEIDEEYRKPEQKQNQSEIMLGKWKEKFSSSATYRAFIEALLSCGKTSDAIEACKAIASSMLHNAMSYFSYTHKNFTMNYPLFVCRYPNTS